MPDFSNWRKTELWFAQQPPKVVAALAARTALRMLPFLSLEVTWRDSAPKTDADYLAHMRLVSEFTENVLSVFRATALAVAGARISGRDRHFAEAAFDAAAAAFDAAEQMYSGSADAAYVAQIALECAVSQEPDNFAYSIAHYNGIDLAALTSDADWFEQRPRLKQNEDIISDFLRRPLWPGGISESAKNSWHGLKWALPRDESWWIWTDWYEKYLSGTSEIPKLEIALPKIGDEIWQRDCATANKILLRLVEEGALGAPAVSEITRPLPGPTPVAGVLSPVDFVTSPHERIRAVPSADVQPMLTSNADRQDHKPRLDLCRLASQSLLDLIDQQKVNVREGYARSLRGYLTYLPKDTRKRNLLFADQEARILRDMFAADVEILPTEFASRLRSMLQAHQALRVFYPGLTRFYEDIRFGRTNDPLPIDAAEHIAKIVAEAPELFDPSVRDALAAAAPQIPARSAPAFPDEASGDPRPPADPIGDVSTEKAQAYTRAGIINRLWAFFQKGETIEKNTEAWAKTGAEMAPHVARVVGWLAKFIGAGN